MNQVNHSKKGLQPQLIRYILSVDAKSIIVAYCKRALGPVYTKHQRERFGNSEITLAILFSLKSMETLENLLQPHSGASSQSCCSVDADARYKRALRVQSSLWLHIKKWADHGKISLCGW